MELIHNCKIYISCQEIWNTISSSKPKYFGNSESFIMLKSSDILEWKCSKNTSYLYDGEK
jgi:hypothetical protein